MERVMRFQLAQGYAIQKQIKSMPAEIAAEHLIAKRHLYTKILSEVETASVHFVRHIWTCPFCGNRIPAYDRNFGGQRPKLKIRRDFADRWATSQMSFFTQDDSELELQKPISSVRAYTCPACRQKSEATQGTLGAKIVVGCQKIALSVEITDMEMLFSLPWITDCSMNISFPLMETVTFHFKNGRTYLKLHDSAGHVFSVRDITEQEWTKGPTCEALSKYTVLRRAMKHCFGERFGKELPYSEAELTSESFVLMTRFLGYDRSFYDAIPFGPNSYRILCDLSGVARRLHKPQSALKLLSESTLPKAKTVKKLLLGHPEILFYIRECEALWDVLQDVNYFRRLLEHTYILEILAQLHDYPGMLQYYRDYAFVKSNGALLKRLTEVPDRFNSYAIGYAAMSRQRRKKEQLQWKREFSTSADPKHPTIQPCKIDGLYFTLLTTTRQCRAVGEQMQNCLIQWSPFNGAVVAIYQKMRPIAAMEIYGTNIAQAYQTENRPIEADSHLERAIRKWCKLFGINENQP